MNIHARHGQKRPWRGRTRLGMLFNEPPAVTDAVTDGNPAAADAPGHETAMTRTGPQAAETARPGPIGGPDAV